MANYLPALPDGRRIRSYFTRLTLATRGILLLITLAYIAHLFVPKITTWGALIPDEININTLHRLTSFAFLHKNFFHFLLNAIALVPLIDRFEAEHGTVVTFLLFVGPFATLPGGIYFLIEHFIFRSNGSVIGSSVFVFLLLANEAIKTYRQNPHFTILDYNVPTWITPLVLVLVVTFLVPQTSLLGHLCGTFVGYLWGLGWIRFLAPHDKILRWVEGKLNLLGRLPHYVSVDQKTFGRYGVLPSTRSPSTGPGRGTLGTANGAAVGPLGSTQRLGP